MYHTLLFVVDSRHCT